jgi:hypothetical protein
MGDTNIDMLKPNTVDTKYFQNLISCFSLIQIVTEPTRITDRSQTLIDIICVSKNLSISCLNTVDMSGLSDHCLVSCHIDIIKEKHKIRQFVYRNFSNFISEDFFNDSQLINWNALENIGDVNEKLRYLNENVTNLFNYHAPIVVAVAKKPYRPWITYTIRKMIKLKNNAFKRFLKNKNLATYEYYKELRNYTLNAIRNEKRAYLKFETNKAKSNPQKLWKCFSTIGIQKQNLTEIPKSLQNVEEINNYFYNSVNSLLPDNQLINFYNNNVNNDTNANFTLTSVTSTEICESVRLINTEAVGADGINNKMLTIVLPIIMISLTNIINECFKMGCFPNIWKTALVCPLPKIPNPSTFSDLRPISILPCMSKIIERIVHTRLNKYLNQFNLLPTNQSGFRKNFSTCTALTKITDDACLGLDSGKVTILLLLDFSKAFDSINHKLLLAKLHFFGFDLVALKFIESYLGNRQQMVKLNGNVSEPKPIHMGVPQGSILGPLLFTIFTSDLPDQIKNCKTHLYADDTQIYLSFNPNEINSSIALVNDDLKAIVSWANKNSLQLNPGKSKALLIGNTRLRKKTLLLQKYSLLLDKTELTFVESAKNLGVIVDSHLNFEQHVNKKCNAAYLRLKTLYKYKNDLPDYVKYNLVDSLVMSQFSYALTLYYSYLTSAYKNKIQKVLNSCIRFSFGISRSEHITPYLNKYKLLNVENRYILLLLKLIYKVIKNNSPIYLCDLMVKRENVNSLNLRHNQLMIIPRHNSTKFKSSFTYLAAIMYNDYFKYFNISYLVFVDRIKEELLEKQKQ